MNIPPKFTLNDSKTGRLVKNIKDNSALLTKLEAYNYSTKEFSTINVNGNDLNMWMLKPANFDPSKTYPLLMFQYSNLETAYLKLNLLMVIHF